ncbi:MAG TPA: YicC/YloC family endoribonuclease [Candidatus Babeliales bacterium]|nr:YicC/YloC family endoribonuclease [Candidatus Babeliales bacterium]
MKKYTITSMTGFASKTFVLIAPSGERSSISMNLKSLNSRFFENTIKLPMTLTHLETTIIKQFKEKLRRGHIYFSAYLSNPNIFEGTITPAMTIIDSYMQAMNQIKTKYNLSDDIKIDNIVRLPNIFSKEEQPLDETSTHQILAAVTDLIEKVMQDRAIEGNASATDLNNRITIIKKEMVAISERAHVFVKECKKKVHATLQEIGADENLIANAQKSGLYSMLDKIDIHEEITRLNSHLEKLIEILSATEAEKGKRLDFTLQELAREINTITAKCSDSTISAHAINVKVEIEKMREQIQNIV